MAAPLHTTVIWANPAQLELARALVQRAGLELVAAGSPQKGQSGAVAAGLGTKAADDLRGVLHESRTDLVLLLAVGDFGAGAAAEDAGAVAAAHARGVRVLSAEPLPGNALELEAGGWTTLTPSPAASIRTLGLPRLSRVFREAQETLGAFGAARSVLVEHWAAPHQGSLGARLVGAIDLVHWLVGETESIDAAYVPTGVGSRRLLEGAPSSVAGDLNATIRTVDGRSALIAVSNAAPRWNLCVTLLSEQGRLRFYDDGFEWLGPDGMKRDEHRDPARIRGSAAPDHAAEVLCESLWRVLDDALPDPGPLNVQSILPVAHAAMLSARTGSPERPALIRSLITT
ncbi:MAG TPA: hypothetical protein VD997_01600 [Phycisphaerales bacterium]|nr:hypothetical protein [Phycisphaerales bacterium]